MIPPPPKPLIFKVWVSGRGLARDWQAWESDRSQPVLEKQRTRYDIECGDFDLAGGTVGWELERQPGIIEKIDVFARNFVAAFVFKRNRQAVGLYSFSSARAAVCWFAT